MGPDPSEETHETSLPDDVVAGVQRLRTMRPPRLLTPGLWPRGISDAIALVDTGWASKALALGWSPLDLFGAVTDTAGDPFSDGLAVWLAERKLLAIPRAMQRTLPAWWW